MTAIYSIPSATPTVALRFAIGIEDVPSLLAGQSTGTGNIPHVDVELDAPFNDMLWSPGAWILGGQTLLQNLVITSILALDVQHIRVVVKNNGLITLVGASVLARGRHS